MLRAGCLLISLASISTCGLPPVSMADSAAHMFERAAPRARDRMLNRTASLGASFARQALSPAHAANASANVVAVTQSGAGNTVMIDVRQSNTGTVAAGVALNGVLALD